MKIKLDHKQRKQAEILFESCSDNPDLFEGAIYELIALRSDLESAAGELPVPLPEPGTDMARLLTANVILKRRLESTQREADPGIRSDWERAHELLDGAGILSTPKGEMGVHLIDRLKAVLAVVEPIGRLSAGCCHNLKFLCNVAPETVEAIAAHRAAYRPRMQERNHLAVTMPTDDALEAIIATKTSGKLFFRQVGPYTLSIIYRQCSAMGASDMWYPESMIFSDGHIAHQGEDWGDFRRFHSLETEDDVISFLTPPTEDERA